MKAPLLKLRSHFTFRSAFGTPKNLAARVEELGAPAAALVDPNTWGVVEWSRALAESSTRPLFGAELPVAVEEGAHRKPRAWLLAESSLPPLYRAVSSAEERSPAWYAALSGVVRFPGQALADPEAFDYVDLQAGSSLALAHSLRLAQHTGRPTALAVSCAYPRPADRDAFLAITDSRRMRLEHVPTDEEIRAQFAALDDDRFRSALRGAQEVAERCAGVTVREAPMIDFPGDLRAEVEEGIRYRLERGHIDEWTQEYTERMERELALIESKGFRSYFLVVGDLVRYAKKHMLVGPARGSAAGSLVSYLLRITEVDPLVHGLIFERFIDVNRGGYFYTREFYDAIGVDYD